MKFLLHGNSPTAKTGYGVQIGLLAERLKAAGHDVAISNTFGVQGSNQQWRGIPILTQGYDINTNDLIHWHADYFFDGEPGWIVTLIDVWAVKNPLLREYNVAAWVPIDHFPVPPLVRQFFSETRAVPVAMSRFGYDLLYDEGLDPVYIPLAVDTTVYQPTETVTVGGREMSGRDLIAGTDPLPDDAFIVGMVAMNKGWAKDRKGFNEAFWAFGQFIKTHPNAVLYVHAEKLGLAEGQHLENLRIHAGIPDTNIRWPNQYAYRSGYEPEAMAAIYSAFDVLLAPSHGEGFCVPLIEAQACGTPVIATDFSAQSELINNGWPIMAQPEWDPAHNAAFVCPLIDSVLERLHEAYNADRAAMADACVEFAGQYDATKVFVEYWLPFIANQLDLTPQKVDVEREPMPEADAVAVLCPVVGRPQNVAPLVESFGSPKGARLVFVAEESDVETLAAIEQAGADVVVTSRTSFAEKLNDGYRATSEPWLLVIGDDVRFHAGWLEAARGLSGDFDVIGTNDTAGKVKNPKVASGAHADHFFVRRAYVEEHGGCLDGPGVLAPEAYHHWYTDMEIVKLAKARGVFTPCFASVVEHLHPGYDGDEAAREADPTYMKAVEWADLDAATWADRLPLIEMQRVSRANI